MKKRYLFYVVAFITLFSLRFSIGYADEKVTKLIEIKESHPHFDKKANTTSVDVSLQNKSKETLYGAFMVVADSLNNPDVSIENPDGYTQGLKPFFIYDQNELDKGKKTQKKVWLFKSRCEKKVNVKFEMAYAPVVFLK